TGVQTCALPICHVPHGGPARRMAAARIRARRRQARRDHDGDRPRRRARSGAEDPRRRHPRPPRGRRAALTRTGHPAGPVPGPVVGLLLAAGIGRRFDPEGRRDKLLADAGGIAVATRAARNLADACDRVIAVVRPGASTLREALAAGGAAEIVECPDARLGMGHSLAHDAFAASVHRPRRIVLALADMPWIEPATIRALIAAADAADAADGGDAQEGDASTDAGT